MDAIGREPSKPATVVAIIMAGGSGERFWPASRLDRPKQFLRLGWRETMFQAAVKRISPLVEASWIFPVTGERYLHVIGEQAPEIPAEQIIIEPMGRNTAACLALAAFHLRAVFPGEDPVMVVLASDHIIQREEHFLEILRAAIRASLTEDNAFILGIPPTGPNTGYGYIHYDKASAGEVDGVAIHAVRGFREKPNRDTAQEYLATGEYLWNSGMFIWKTSFFLELLAEHLPRHYERLSGAFHHGKPSREELAEAFAGLTSVSVDYGIMEKTNRIRVIPAEIGWDDVGNWAGMAAHLPVQGSNTVIGEATLLETQGCLIYSDGGHIATVGMEDTVVVKIGQTVLVCPKNRAQDVRRIVEELRRQGRQDLL